MRTRDAHHEEVHHFDAVAICSGMYWTPRKPDLDGIGGITGRIVHSAKFKSAADRQDQRVIVAGNGVSGMDIAALLTRQARSVD